jgi:hypothetical protein
MNTHCPKGHEMNQENSYHSKRGEIQCRTCRRAAQKDYARRVKLAEENAKKWAYSQKAIYSSIGSDPEVI